MAIHCPSAVKVVPKSHYHIQTWFEDGRVTLYNVLPDIEKIKPFGKLKDEREFQKVYVTNNGGSIAWGDGDIWQDPDMDVEVPYLDGVIVEK